MFWISQPVRFHQFPRKGKIKELEWSSKCTTDVQTFNYEDEDVAVLIDYWLRKRPLDTPFFESAVISFLVPLKSMIVSRPVTMTVPGDTVLDAAIHEFWDGQQVVPTHEFRRNAPSLFIEEKSLPFSCLTDYDLVWIRTDNYVDRKEHTVKLNASHFRELKELLSSKPCVVAPSLPLFMTYIQKKRYSVFMVKGAFFVFKYKNELIVDLVAAVVKDDARAVRAFSTLMKASPFRVVRIHCNSDTASLLIPGYKTTHVYVHAFNYFPPTLKSKDCLII
jgi:hypothetical protein